MPYNDNGQNVFKSWSDRWDYRYFRRTGNLGTGESATVDFKVDYFNTRLHLYLEPTDGTPSRWALQSDQGKLRAQYRINGGAWNNVDLINPLVANTWYSVTLRMDDTNGFRVDVQERGGRHKRDLHGRDAGRQGVDL